MNDTEADMEGLAAELAAAIADSARFLGWPGILRAVAKAAMTSGAAYEAGVAEATARYIENREGWR